MRIISGLTLAAFLGLALSASRDADAVSANISRNIAIGSCTRIAGGILNPEWDGIFNSGTSTMTLDCASAQNFSQTEPGENVNSVIARVTDQTPGSVSCQLAIVGFGGGVLASSSSSTAANGSSLNMNFGGFGISGIPYISCTIPPASGASQSGFHGFQVVQN